MILRPKLLQLFCHCPKHQTQVGPRNAFAQLVLSLPSYQTGQSDTCRESTTFQSFMIELTWHHCFLSDTVWATETYRKNTVPPGGSLSMEMISFSLSFSPHINNIFCHPLSCVCLLCDPLTVASLCFSTLCLGDASPCFCACVCLCVRCVFVCVYPLQPHRSLYTILALLLCQLCAFEQMCVYSNECVYVYNTVHPCVCAVCSFAYHISMCVHVYCEYVSVSISFLPRPSFSLSIHCVQCCVQWP